MNTHLDDGQIRAALDGELEQSGLDHLATCTSCQTRQAALRTQSERVADKLAFLSSPTREAGLSA